MLNTASVAQAVLKVGLSSAQEFSRCIVLQKLHVNGSEQHDNKRSNRETDRERVSEERERECVRGFVKEHRS